MALPVAEFLALEHGTEYWGAAAGVKQTSDAEVLVFSQTHGTLHAIQFKRSKSASCGQQLSPNASPVRLHKRRPVVFVLMNALVHCSLDHQQPDLHTTGS